MPGQGNVRENPTKTRLRDFIAGLDQEAGGRLLVGLKARQLAGEAGPEHDTISSGRMIARSIAPLKSCRSWGVIASRAGSIEAASPRRISSNRPAQG